MTRDPAAPVHKMPRTALPYTDARTVRPLVPLDPRPVRAADHAPLRDARARRGFRSSPLAWAACLVWVCALLAARFVRRHALAFIAAGLLVASAFFFAAAWTYPTAAAVMQVGDVLGGAP